METGPWLKVSSDRLEKPGIEPATPCLQGKRFIHYATVAPTNYIIVNMYFLGVVTGPNKKKCDCVSGNGSENSR